MFAGNVDGLEAEYNLVKVMRKEIFGTSEPCLQLGHKYDLSDVQRHRENVFGGIAAALQKTRRQQYTANTLSEKKTEYLFLKC